LPEQSDKNDRQENPHYRDENAKRENNNDANQSEADNNRAHDHANEPHQSIDDERSEKIINAEAFAVFHIHFVPRRKKSFQQKRHREKMPNRPNVICASVPNLHKRPRVMPREVGDD